MSNYKKTTQSFYSRTFEMRPFIFGFSQEKAVHMGLNLKDLLLLDYLISFASSGNMVVNVKDKKQWFYISRSKILKDLPILAIEDRQLLRMLNGLEKKGIFIQQKVSNASNICFDTQFVNSLYSSPTGYILDDKEKYLKKL